MSKKRKAMKPVQRSETHTKYGLVLIKVENYFCPRCRHVLSAGPMYQPRYCDQCGQRVRFDGIVWKAPETIGYVERRDVI